MKTNYKKMTKRFYSFHRNKTFTQHCFFCFVLFCFLLLVFCLFGLFRAAPEAYGGSQARGRIGAVAASLQHSHSHSNTRSEPRLQPISQLTATPDP